MASPACYAEYEAAGIPEYWIVEGRKGRAGTWLYLLGDDGTYAEALPDEDGRLWSRGLAADPLPSVVECFRAIAPDIFGGGGTTSPASSGS